MEQNQAKILLIEPPFYRLFKDTYSLDRYPLSLGYLAGAIRKKTNWKVMAYNADFYFQSEPMNVSYLSGHGFYNYLNNLKVLSGKVWAEIKSTIQAYNPSIVAISAKSQNFASVCLVAKFSKEINNKIIVIVGGPHPTMAGSRIFECPDIDIIVKGEGEDTIVELLKAIERQDQLDNIRGVSYRKDGRIIENAPREFIEDLDSLCFPHENAPEVLKDYQQYPKAAFKNIFAIRGCPYQCLFCGSHKIWSRQPRFRSPENIVKEAKGLLEMGLKLVNFDDDTFGVNKKYINELCNAFIEHCPGLKWSCELPARLVDKEIMSLMKKAGCYSILIGVESGNNSILKAMRKNTTVQELLKACALIERYGIKLQASFMVGFPYETEETLNDTIRVMKKIKCETLIYSIFNPYPGTEIFEFCKDNKLIADDYDVSLHNHQSPASCFCINIAPERFRILVSKVEKMVDRKNSLSRIKRLFSLNTFRRAQELGIGRAFQKGIRVFIAKK